MATLNWIAGNVTRTQRATLTITSATVGNTNGLTVAGKTISYTAVTGDSTSTIASALTTLLSNAIDSEFRTMSFAVNATSANVIDITAATPGFPFTASAFGTATPTYSVTVANSSKNDLNATANYSGGALPSNGDTLVFENGPEGVFWNLNALSSVDLAAVIVRSNLDGPNARLGLPTFNTLGFREYRGTTITLGETPILQIYESPTANAETYRFVVDDNAACALDVYGQANGVQIGDEVTVWRGGNASNTVRIVGGSLAVAVGATETAVISSLQVTDGTCQLGSGVTLTTVNAINSIVLVRSNVTTLIVDGPQSTVTVEGTATGGTVTVDDGTLVWNSSGTITTLRIGSGGTLDATGSRLPFTCTNVTLEEGATILDPYGRITLSNPAALNRTSLDKISWTTKTGCTVTIA